MKWGFFSIILLLLIMAGCQSNDTDKEAAKEHNDVKNNVVVEEVINNYNGIQNLDGINSFIENVNKQTEAKLNFVQYGIEGQRGVMALTYNGEQINVSYSVDGDFIEKYNCKNILVKAEEKVKKYILSKCTGSFNGDVELFSIPNNEQINMKIDNKDVREVVWGQLSSQQKEQIGGTWQNAKVSKVILNKEMMTLVKDKSYEGKEVYLIDFPTKVISKPNNMIVYADINTFSYIGNGLVE